MGNLLAGAAMRKITPSEEQLAAINAEMSEKQRKMSGSFDGIAEDIYVRVIVLSDGEKRVVLASSDTICFPGQYIMSRRLTREYGIEPEGCLLACTHNHEFIFGSMGEDDDPVYGRPHDSTPAIKAYFQMIHDLTAEAVGEAIEKLQPARIGAVSGKSYINANRDLPTPCGGIQLNNFHGPSDHELLVVKVEALDGTTIALLANHATHSNAMVWNVYDGTYAKIGGDIGGGVSRFVEKANKNAFPVLWVIGAAGDQNPIVRSTWRSITVDDEGNFDWVQRVFKKETNLKQMQELRCIQGMEILELADKVTDFTDEFSFAGAETTRTEETRKSYVSQGLYFERNNSTDVRKQLLYGERPEPIPDKEPFMTHIFHLMSICGIGVAGVNCEAYSNLGTLVKNMIPSDKVIFSGLSYGRIGYIPDAEGEKLNGFGTCMSNAISGERTEELYRDGFGELIQKVYG